MLKKMKIKSLVAWSISEGRVDQKQVINFVGPNNIGECLTCNISHRNT